MKKEEYLGVDPFGSNGEMLITRVTTINNFPCFFRRTWNEARKVLEIA